MSKHTKGAIKAAEIMTGGKYGEKGIVYPTTYGNKCVEGIADIIDRETKMPELLIDIKGALAALSQSETFQTDINLAKVWLRRAIRKGEE